MVLFAKTALTRMCLAAQKRNFAYMIKDVNMPQTKVPHPTHVKGVAMWRNLFFLAGIPAIILVNINAFYFEDQHPARPEFKPYDHMRKRSKKFPWGDGNHTLFHNEYYNALPEGYETEERAHGEHH